MKSYYIYILASKRNGTLYTGITNNLIRRVYEHKQGFVDGFTRMYCINRLVYFEETNNISSALKRERQIKSWKRKWKLQLIESINPGWKDLYCELI